MSYEHHRRRMNRIGLYKFLKRRQPQKPIPDPRTQVIRPRIEKYKSAFEIREQDMEPGLRHRVIEFQIDKSIDSMLQLLRENWRSLVQKGFIKIEKHSGPIETGSMLYITELWLCGQQEHADYYGILSQMEGMK